MDSSTCKHFRVGGKSMVKKKARAAQRQWEGGRGDKKLEEELLVIISWLQQKGRRTSLFKVKVWNETSAAFVSCVGMNFGWWCAVVCILLRKCLCVCGSGLSLSLCLLLEVGGLSWCHWVQQAEPERGPLLAAVAWVVTVPQKHTHTRDRREEWHPSDCPTAHSIDTSTGLASFWTKLALLDSSCCILQKWS